MFNLVLFLSLFIPLLSSGEEPQHKNSPKQIQNSSIYTALLWYRASGEKVAAYRQVFTSALTIIESTVKTQKPQAGAWGVIFSLDGTLLDNSPYLVAKLTAPANSSFESYTQYLQNNLLAPTPGALEISCAIQKLGGKVFIISNRLGTTLRLSQNNLAHYQICYDALLLANDDNDTNKNPRFNAVIVGDYENIISSSIHSATPIYAYFGSQIEDFPHLKQNIISRLNHSPLAVDTAKYAADPTQLDKFGTSYFILPNPIAGLWQQNHLN